MQNWCAQKNTGNACFLKNCIKRCLYELFKAESAFFKATATRLQVHDKYAFKSPLGDPKPIELV